MTSTVVVGLQWGDEGKGKIIDVLSVKHDYVVRFNGGNNAGHTVVVKGIKFPLSLLPSGALQDKHLLISQGEVINPKVLLSEIEMLENAGYKIKLTIDPRCHIVMPYHQLLDKATEIWKGKSATGSLHLGIGYCYEDRNNRAGIRFEDLIRPQILKEKIIKIFPLKKAIIEKVYGLDVSIKVSDIINEYQVYGSKLKKYLGDVTGILNQALGVKAILFEQAHGTMLDPVFGTYPYTVAPPTLASSVFYMAGIRQFPLKVIGIVKAYTTRVGNGPFPTEQINKTGDKIRVSGSEFGTVSKRPRRCGWLDLPLLRYAVRLNGCTSIIITKLDVLTGIKNIKVCTGYRYNGKIKTEFPAEINTLPDHKPIYKTLQGWGKSLTGISNFKNLPENAKKYVKFISKELKQPVSYVSIGPDRSAIISL